MVAGHSIIPAMKEKREKERKGKKVSSNQMVKYEESFQKEIFVILFSFFFLLE